jgi:HSP90 family molecular chaperone
MTPNVEVPSTTTTEKPRTPALRILSELSRGTYVSYSRATKELLSNAWDALATDVQIKISDDLNEITILDDGVGMSEADIRERFLRIGGSKAAGVATRGTRRLIGHKGIGALSVINICKEVRVLTTQQGSTDRMEVTLDISKVLELAKQDEDLESHYVYQLTKWPNEDKNSHYTYITLRNLTADMREFLSKKGVTVDRYVSNVGELSGLDQLNGNLHW